MKAGSLRRPRLGTGARYGASVSTSRKSSGTTCATSTATVGGLSGGTTAATGWNMAANMGHTFGSGIAPIGEAANATGDNVCVLISGSGPVNVAGGYVQQ